MYFIIMSRQAQLPPRCPFQKKPVYRSFQDSISPPLNEFNRGHHKSSSQSSFFEEQPVWLDELLCESDSNSSRSLHRRSASDSVTLLNGIMDSFPGLTAKVEDENSVAAGLESGCIYGPNSPRKRVLSTLSGTALASAMSESILHDPVQYVFDSPSVSGISNSDDKEDIFGSVTEPTAEAKLAKRHSGQRSRVRKLQYIAELEKNVNVLQGVESELSLRVASLLQQRINLALENSKLKQRVAKVQQEKLMVESQYQVLKKEAERLKIGLEDRPRNKVKKFPSFNTYSDTAELDAAAWKMLNIGKLNLS